MHISSGNFCPPGFWLKKMHRTCQYFNQHQLKLRKKCPSYAGLEIYSMNQRMQCSSVQSLFFRAKNEHVTKVTLGVVEFVTFILHILAEFSSFLQLWPFSPLAHKKKNISLYFQRTKFSCRQSFKTLARGLKDSNLSTACVHQPLRGRTWQ